MEDNKTGIFSSVNPTLTNWYDVLIRDPEGLKLAYKRDGKWTIDHPEKAIECLMKENERLRDVLNSIQRLI